MSMAKETPAHWKSYGHQERRPIDRMEPDNVFANDLTVGGPKGGWVIWGRKGITGHGQVIDQCIEPDVDGLAWVARNPDTPG